MKYTLRQVTGSPVDLGDHKTRQAALEAALRKLGYMIEEAEPRPRRVRISRDEYPENPREEWDNASRMVCFHKRYNLGDKHNYDKDDYNSWDDFREYLVKEEDAYAILPLYLYDHGEITMSTAPFSCRWDSGQVGFIYMTRKAMEEKFMQTLDRAYEIMRNEVTEYDRYLTGDVWGYEIQEEVDGEWETADSCWGYFGREFIMEKVKAMGLPVAEED